MSRLLPVLDWRRVLVVSALSCGLAAATTASAEPVTVAFTGDQGTGADARAVLQLAADRGADLLMLQGDFGYDRGAAGDWIDDVESVLGPDFPVLGVVGNHENHEWPRYRAWLERRAAQAPGLECDGAIGVRARCTFRGLSIVQVAPGVHEVPGVSPDDGYARFIADRLADDPAPWRICSWHKNQHDMQTGDKTDATGWGVYDACLAAGGIVATAHEHVYARTHLMSDFRTGAVADRGDRLTIGPGRSIAFVSGLGGKSTRPVSVDDDRWAATYSADDGARGGALFCTFDGAAAECRFEDVSGAVPDTFSLASVNVAGDARSVSNDPARWTGPGDAPATTGTVTGGGAIDPSALFGGLGWVGWLACRRRRLRATARSR